jgi:hypothetical protein
MDEASIIQYITETFNGVNVAVNSGDSFFIYDPARNLPPERQFPFATLVTGDHYDSFSNLDRPSVFRLNIGVSKDTYRSLFGPQPPSPGGSGVVATGHDFTALDQIMPHPVYSPQSWVCVLNPSETTCETVKQLLADAYNLVVSRYGRRAGQDEA